MEKKYYSRAIPQFIAARRLVNDERSVKKYLFYFFANFRGFIFVLIDSHLSYRENSQVVQIDKFIIFTLKQVSVKREVNR